MEKKVKYGSLVDSADAIRLIVSHDFGDSSFNIDVAIFAKKINDLIEFYFEEQNKLVKLLGIKKENGQYEIPPTHPNFQKFQERVVELRNKEISIEILPLSPEFIKPILKTPAHFLSIVWWVDCLSKPKQNSSKEDRKLKK